MIRAVLIICLLAVAGGFTMITRMAWQGPAVPAALDEPPSQSEDTISALTLVEITPNALSTFTERPPFSAARRPPPPEAPGTPLIDPTADLLFGEYEISGVVMLGNRAMAMLRDQGGKLTRLRVGDQIETRSGVAEVTAITLNGLTFRRGADTFTAEVRREGAKTE